MPEITSQNLIDQALRGEGFPKDLAKGILTSSDENLLTILDAAFAIRKKYWGKEVLIHIINNAQNGHCPEDCSYCVQAKSSKAGIKEYPIKSKEEFLQEAKQAYERGAHRYCMVFAGRGPSKSRTEKLVDIVKTIKENYPLEICVSAGLLDEEKASQLKEAGLDRLNHNLNTSAEHYSKICTTHTYEDRINTLKAAHSQGIGLCSGVIVGMGESMEDILEVAYQLRKINAASIPVNFFIPVDGTPLEKPKHLTPDYCLRVLSLFRFINPQAEIRVAAGREIYLRHMQPLALYPANSLFLEGYLNVKGDSNSETLQMIEDAGFTIKSEIPLKELLEQSPSQKGPVSKHSSVQPILKDLKDLRPHLSS